MGQAGDVFEMPDGSQYILRTPTAATQGEYVEFEWVFPAGTFAPPPHLHPSQVEEYEVLEGRLDVTVDGRWQTLEAGESVSVPRAALHTFRNRSGAVVRVRNWHRPAVRFEEFIEQTSAALRAVDVKRRRDPRIAICLSMIMLAFEDTLQPGRRRERIPMRALAYLGRLAGLPGGAR